MHTIEKSVDENSVNQERGLRLRYARSQTLLSRRDFSQVIGHTERSQLNWETGESPISEKSAFKIILALQNCKVKCSYEWLMNGAGEGPQRIENLEHLMLNSALIEADEQLVFETDIMLFKKRHPESIVLEMRDDKAAPRYYRHDFLFAPRISKEQFKDHWPMGYLFEIKPSVFFPAFISKNTASSYSVESFHQHQDEKFHLNNVTLAHFYPIITVKRNFFSAY